MINSNSERKMNILMVHNYYQLPGGEDTVFQNEKRLLEEHGHNVITYTRDNNEIKKYNIIQKLLFPFSVIFNFKTYIDIILIIKQNNIDIVHVHNTLSLISPAVFYAAVKMKVPIVQTLHNFRMICPNGLLYRDNHICEDCINGGLFCALKHKCYRDSFFQTLAIVLMLKIHRSMGICKRVNFICLTEFNKSKLLLINNKKQIIDEHKVFVKPNFVFDEPLNNSNDYKVKNDNSKGYYLYVGRLDRIKGIDLVLEAFSKMRDKELHVIGSGRGEYIEEYSRYNNIKFLGQLSHDAVMIEMVRGRAIIFASKWYEGLPMTIVESYRNALPVIASDVGNAKELVEDGVTGLHSEINNVDSLIDEVNQFVKLDVDEMKNNARNEYISKYNERIGYKNLINIYSDIAKNH